MTTDFEIVSVRLDDRLKKKKKGKNNLDILGKPTEECWQMLIDLGQRAE